MEGAVGLRYGLAGMTVPDCVSCDSANSLEYDYVNPGGSVWYVCKTCTKRNLVKEGRVVYPPTSKTDVSGRTLDGP